MRRWRHFRAPPIFPRSWCRRKRAAPKYLAWPTAAADTVNCIKQAAEFGLVKGGMKVAGLLFLIHDVHGVGLASAQGVLLTEPFYWNMNDGTRAFAKRFAAKMPGNVPGSVHAGQYSAYHALPQSRGACWLRQGESQWPRGDGGDESDADRRPVVRQRHGAQGWAGHPRFVSVRGEIAGTIQGSVGLLQPEAYRSGGGSVPADERGGCSLV